MGIYLSPPFFAYILVLKIVGVLLQVKDSELNNLRNLTCLFIPALNALNRFVE